MTVSFCYAVAGNETIAALRPSLTSRGSLDPSLAPCRELVSLGRTCLCRRPSSATIAVSCYLSLLW